MVQRNIVPEHLAYVLKLSYGAQASCLHLSYEVPRHCSREMLQQFQITLP